jgi:hypothetical protein
MTLQLSRQLSRSEVKAGEAEHRLNKELVPVTAELAQKANAHVTRADVATPGTQLPTVPGRILLVLIDTSAWTPFGSVDLPVEHELGDEVIVKDSTGNATLRPITVTAADPIAGTSDITADFGSARFMSTGESWVSL